MNAVRRLQHTQASARASTTVSTSSSTKHSHPRRRVIAITALTLSAALYDCCQLPPEPIVNGAPRADGTLDRLSPEDLKVCWELRRVLASRDAAVAFRFVASFHASHGSACPHPDACALRPRASDGRP